MPPALFVMNPREPSGFPLGRWNLYIGGAGRSVEGYVNLDLFPMTGVDVAADAEALPFPDGVFQRVECDAVLEHVRDPELVMGEIERVLAPGGFVHLVTPFCHPFHEYPKDYRRFTLDGESEINPHHRAVLTQIAFFAVIDACFARKQTRHHFRIRRDVVRMCQLRQTDGEQLLRCVAQHFTQARVHHKAASGGVQARDANGGLVEDVSV